MKLEKFIKKLKKYPIDEKWVKSNRLLLEKEIFERNLGDKRLLLREVFSGRLLARQFNNIKSMPIIIPLLLITSLSGGGVVYAAQGSLPSDMLYPVKLASEKAIETIALSDEMKLDLNLKFASRRLDEINRVLPLEKNGDLIKKPLENFEQRIENTASAMEKIQDKDKRIETYRKFEERLADYQSQLDKVKTPEAANGGLESLKETQKNLISQETYVEKQIIKEQPPENLKGLKEKAEGKIKAAANKIEETERYIEKLKDLAEELGIDIKPHPDYKSIIDRMNKAKELLDEARSDFKNGDYVKARDKAANVIEICIDIQILITKEISKAHQTVLIQGSILSLSDDESSFLMELHKGGGIKLMDSKYESPEGETILVLVTEKTKIILGDKKISFSDLEVGNLVKVFGEYGSVVKRDGAKMKSFSADKIEVVKIGNEFSLLSSVESVDTESRYIKISKYIKTEIGEKGVTEKIYVSPDAKIIRYGKEVDIDAIQAGDFGSFEGYYDKEKDVLVASKINIPVIVKPL